MGIREKLDDMKTVSESVVPVIAKSFMDKMQLQQDSFEEKTNILLKLLEDQITNMVSFLSIPSYIASSSEASSNHQGNASPRQCGICQETFPTKKAICEHRKIFMKTTSQLYRRVQPLSFLCRTDVLKMILSKACLLQTA